MGENNHTPFISPMGQVFRALPGLYMLLSPELIIIDCTEQYSRTAGFDIEKVLGLAILDTFPDNSNEASQKAKDELEVSLQHVLSHKEPHTMPMLRFDVSGAFEERFWTTTNTPILDSEGEISYILHETRDITEQVLNERNDKRLNLLNSALRAVPWEYDNVLQQSSWGPNVKEIFGYTQEEMVSNKKLWESRIHPDDFLAVQASIKKALGSKERVWTDEYRFLKADNTYAYVLGQAYIKYDNQGHPALTIGSMIELSGRKRVEQDLQESNERFHHLIEILPQMAWTASPSGQILHFNKSWYSYTGMPQGQTEGWINVVHPDDSAELLTTYHHSISTGESYEMEYRIRDYLDGSYRWFLERAVPMLNENGKVELWIGTFTDIEDQKQVLEQLRAKDQFLENVLKCSPAHLCILHGPGHICKFITPGVYLMYGSRQYIGRPAPEIWPELDAFDFRKLLDQVYHEGVTVHIDEFKTPIDRHQNGQPQEAYFNFKYQPLTDRSGNAEGILISAIEVTELVAARQEAEELLKELQHNQEK